MSGNAFHPDRKQGTAGRDSAAAHGDERPNAPSPEWFQEQTVSGDKAAGATVDVSHAAREHRWVNLSPATAGDVLREHFPIEVRCDHETSQDKVFCNCSMIDLGWHESVGDAVASWASHVIEELIAHGH